MNASDAIGMSIRRKGRNIHVSLSGTFDFHTMSETRQQGKRVFDALNRLASSRQIQEVHVDFNRVSFADSELVRVIGDCAQMLFMSDISLRLHNMPHRLWRFVGPPTHF